MLRCFDEIMRRKVGVFGQKKIVLKYRIRSIGEQTERKTVTAWSTFNQSREAVKDWSE